MPASNNKTSNALEKPTGSLMKPVLATGMAIVLIFCAVFAISMYRNSEGAIGSKNFDRLINGRRLLADVAPPPAFAIEAYVALLEGVENPDEATKFLETFKARKDEYFKTVDRWAQSKIPTDIKRDLTVDAKEALKEFWPLAENQIFPAVIGSAGQEVSPDLDKQLDKARGIYNQHKTIVEAAILKARSFLRAEEMEIEGNIATASMLYNIVIALGFAIIGGAIFLLMRKVIAPMTSLANYTTQLAAGTQTGDVPYLSRNDEIGKIGHALTILAKANEDKLEAEKAVNEERERVIKMTEEQQAEREGREQQTNQAVEALAGSLQKMVSGDLTATISEPFEGELDKLRVNMNRANEQFAETFKKIINSSDGINSGVREIVTASDDLSQRTEQQAAALEETAATVSHITKTVQKSSEGAENTRKIVETAKNDAQVSGEVVNRALEAMHQIEESAKEINQIISVIDEIAFQTNLLALNAGVEAARAGEAGQGFAVVASEVRALAQRSATAAKEIKELISKSSEQVAGGSKLVGETGETLHRISDQVLEISSVVDEIASDSKEQHASLNELNITVADMDTSTQQNAAMAEQATAACHSLRSEADTLNAMMSKFNFGGAGHAKTATKIVPEAPVAKPKLSRPASVNATTKPSASPAKELMGRVKGAFSSQPQTPKKSSPATNKFSGNAAVQDDNWEEF